MIQDCIVKICNLPIDFKDKNKSPYDLAKESKFEIYQDSISVSEIRRYLIENKPLLNQWQILSWNKRTTGYYLSYEDNNAVGFINEKHQTTFKQEFDTSIDACSEFIYREISSILGLEK
nr:hypothetical protein [Nonlabens ulvanivorans]